MASKYSPSAYSPASGYPAPSYGNANPYGEAEPYKKLKFLVAHTWEIGLLFIILVVCMVVFEKGMHLIEHKIEHSPVPQRGLKKALKKMKDELLVTGFLSLLLTALQGPLNSICIGKKTKTKGPLTTGQDLCKHLFDYDTIHYAHILLFFVAAVNIFHGVLSLVLGCKQVLSFGKEKRWKENGVVQKDQWGNAIKLDKESIEAEAPTMLPLSDKLRHDLMYRVGSQRWWVWWSIKRQFMIIGDESVVTRDLYRAARQCSLEYLNTITYRKYSNGTIQYADDKPSNHFTNLFHKKHGSHGGHGAVHGGGHAAAAHGGVHAAAAHGGAHGGHGGGHGHGHEELTFTERHIHLTRAQLPFVYLANQCLQHNFCKATAADILLPLMVGAAFLLPPIVTQMAITVVVLLMMGTTWWIGIKLQWILLHMAMRYQTRVRKEAVRSKFRTAYRKYRDAKQKGFDVDNGDYLEHLKQSGAFFAPTAANPAQPAFAPKAGAFTRFRSLVVGQKKYVPDQDLLGRAIPSAQLFNTIQSKTKSIVKKQAIEYWTTPFPDSSKLFWLEWPGLVRALTEVGYYTNALVLALVLFCAWKDPSVFKDKAWFWTVNLIGVLHNFWHLSWMVVPAFAVIATTGRHTPIEVVGEVQRMAVFSQVLVAVRATKRGTGAGSKVAGRGDGSERAAGGNDRTMRGSDQFV